MSGPVWDDGGIQSALARVAPVVKVIDPKQEKAEKRAMMKAAARAKAYRKEQEARARVDAEVAKKKAEVALEIAKKKGEVMAEQRAVEEAAAREAEFQKRVAKAMPEAVTAIVKGGGLDGEQPLLRRIQAAAKLVKGGKDEWEGAAADMLAVVAHRVLETLTDEALTECTPKERAQIFGIVYDRYRDATGKTGGLDMRQMLSRLVAEVDLSQPMPDGEGFVTETVKEVEVEQGEAKES